MIKELLTKDIKQFNFNYSMSFLINGRIDAEISITKSEHSNDHYRPDIIDSKFLAAIKGNGGQDGDKTWNIFDSSQNPQSLIEYVRGAEVSSKTADLTSINGVFTSNYKNFEYAYGFQINNESLDVYYDEISRAEFDKDGKVNFYPTAPNSPFVFPFWSGKISKSLSTEIGSTLNPGVYTLPDSRL